MSSETDFLLRLQAPGTKELKVTTFDVFGDPTLFTSQLTQGYTRKEFTAYNNSGVSSGEIVLGSSDVTPSNGMPIPKGAALDIRLATDVPVYFCNTVSGEVGNLRIMEIA